MNDTIFLKNFSFNTYSFSKLRHCDNSHGIESHFIGYLKKGKCTFVSSKLTLNITENDMFYIPKGCKYHSYWSGNDAILFDSIGFKYFPVKGPNTYILQKINYTREIFDCYTPFLDSKEINVKSIGNLYTLLAALQPVLIGTKVSREEQVVDDIIQQMQKNPYETIPYYSKKCDVNEAAVYSCFKKVLGKTPNAVRQEIMCRNAVELLTTTNYSVEEICSRTGFSSSSYFRKILFSVTGQTPSKIRNKGRI